MAHTAVWKVGGSLFDLPDLAARLGELLAQHSEQRVLLIAGGGAAADLVRDWQQRTGTDDETAHWLALRALDFNAHLLAAALPNGRAVTTRDETAFAWERGEQPVLSPTTLVRCLEQQLPQFALPHTWSVTSDSLAAWIATHWPAGELLLLKSRPLPPGLSIADAAQRGFVDAHFPAVAGGVERLGWRDLRGSSYLELKLHGLIR